MLLPPPAMEHAAVCTPTEASGAQPAPAHLAQPRDRLRRQHGQPQPLHVLFSCQHQLNSPASGGTGQKHPRVSVGGHAVSGWVGGEG